MPKNECFQCSISLYKFGFKNEKMDDYSAKMGNKMLKMKTYIALAQFELPKSGVLNAKMIFWAKMLALKLI